MAPLSYRERLLQILSAEARESKESIDYEELVWRVRENALKRNEVLGPRYASFILKALKNFRSRRWVKIITAEGSVRTVDFTASGVKYFRSWGISFIYTPNDSEPNKMTVAELQHQYLIVDDVLQEMYEQFQEYQFLKLESCDLRFLPDAVKNLLERQDELHKQYSELSDALSTDSAVERKDRGYAPGSRSLERTLSDIRHSP